MKANDKLDIECTMIKMNKKEGASSSSTTNNPLGLLKDKWKKVSKAASNGLKKGILPSSSSSKASANSSQASYNSSKKKHKNHPRIIHHTIHTSSPRRKQRSVDDSQVDLETIDLRTPPVTPSPQKTSHKGISPLTHSPARESVIHANTGSGGPTHSIVAKTMSMMTPDMLETLGLTELEDIAKDKFVYDRPQGENDSSPSPKSITPTPMRSPITPTKSPNKQQQHYIQQHQQQTKPQQPQPQLQVIPVLQNRGYPGGYHNDAASCYYFADNDTKDGSTVSTPSSQSSSLGTYEPIPRHPGGSVSHADDTFTFDDDDDDENTYVKFYREASATLEGGDCDALACTGMLLAMPVACGLVCVDNLAGTDYFDRAAETFAQNTNSQRNRAKPPETLEKNMGSSSHHSAYQQRRRGKRDKEAGGHENDDGDGETSFVGDWGLLPPSVEQHAQAMVSKCL